MFSLIGILFLFCCLTEHDLAFAGNIHWTAAYTLKVIAVSLTGGILLGVMLCRAFTKYAEWQLQKAERAAAVKPANREKKPGGLMDSLFCKTARLSPQIFFAALR